MGTYDKLTKNERRRIRRLNDAGHDNTEIAKRTGRGRTTIRRFLDREGKSSVINRYLSESDDAP
jgi:IS30 family transposase